MIGHRTSRLQDLGMALVVGGIIVTGLPTAVVLLRDAFVARDRGSEVNRWLAEHPPVPAEPARAIEAASPANQLDGMPVASLVLDPGQDGYLLDIPKIRLRVVVRELEPEVFSGKNTPRLRRFGLGQVPYSPGLRNVSPGAEGTAVIAGHRTTSGAPLRDLHRLGPGDQIVLRKGEVEQHWKVVYATTVAPHQVEAIQSRPGTRRLAIVACSPPFSDAARLVVYAELEPEGG